ncbi:MAG TPA: hypothetical protein VEW06_06425 [Xanthobacteraceae bacterium]|nr:hypothetical protein [Xanthobacteraceae bacterium]
MADFTVTIEDADQLAGITWAREQYNASLPTNDAGEPVGALADDTAYVQYVMDNAAASYAQQQMDAEWRSAYEEAKAAAAAAKAPAVEEEAPAELEEAANA